MTKKVTQNPQYFQQIDTLRLIAAVFVCLSHWLPIHWIQFFQLGRFGVELFFVISGFLITRILLKLNDSFGLNFHVLKVFFIRRVMRIFPIYYFVVFITFIFHDGHFNDAIVWNLAYLSNFYMLQIKEFPGVMGHFWSLSVEEHFYLIWPILILVIPSPKAIYTIIVFSLIGISSRLLFYFYGYPSIFPKIFTISCFDAFGVGGFLAFIHLYDQPLLNKMRNSTVILLFIVFGFFATLYLDFLNDNANIWDFILFRILASLSSFYLLCFAITSNSRILNNSKLVFLGKLSYSMYLFHNFIPGFLLGLKFPFNIYLKIVFYFVVLFIVSYISWRIIESPFIRIKKKFKYSILVG